jgi:death-on-curing protein
MEYLQLVDILHLHSELIAQSGGSPGLRDRGYLESALSQPRAAFGGVELYAELAEKAAALCFSLVLNHAFVDGNKRVGYAAMRLFLDINDWAFEADVDDAEQTMLQLAAGQMKRPEFTAWVKERARPLNRSENA